MFFADRATTAIDPVAESPANYKPPSEPPLAQLTMIVGFSIIFVIQQYLKDYDVEDTDTLYDKTVLEDQVKSKGDGDGFSGKSNEVSTLILAFCKKNMLQ